VTTTKPCPICDDRGPWPGSDERYAHIRAHHEETCPIDGCGATVNSVGLQAHLLHVHGVDGTDREIGPDSNDRKVTPAVDPEPELDPPPVDEPAPGHVCATCGEACRDLRGLRAHERSHMTVSCEECGQDVIATGLGPHLAAHRRAREASGQAEADELAARREVRRAAGLAEVLAELLPGAAGELLERLSGFVAKHEPDGGRDRWVVATLTTGPWLCRVGQLGLVALKEHAPIVALAVDDVYAHLRHRAATA
jgi:hypothetical protein